MRAITLFLVMLFLPLTAFAESVAVLPVSYKIYRTNKQDEDRAAKVKAAVIGGVEDAGLTPMTGEDIDNESQAFAGEEMFCVSSECPLKVAERVGADLGVVVAVSDHDGQFDIHIYTTYAEPVSASPFGTLKATLKRIRGMVTDSLKEAVRNAPPVETPAAAETETTEEETGPTAEETEETQNEETPATDAEKEPPAPEPQKKKKPIPKPAFWSVFGVSLTIGLGYTGLETFGYIYWQDKKEGWDDHTTDEATRKDELNTVKALQLTCRIMMGVTAAAVITTGVLGFFTDFSRGEASAKRETNAYGRLGGRGGKNDRKSKVARGISNVLLAPVVGENAGGFMVQGAF